MQNKSAIWVFTILLALACLYSISFTFVARGVEADAQDFGKKKADSVNLADGGISVVDLSILADTYSDEYLISMGDKEVYPLLGFTYNFVKKTQINLGLDLQGGMSVTLEVSVEEVLKSLAKDNTDENFKKAIARSKEMQRDAQEEFVPLFSQAWNEMNPDIEMWTAFHSRENKEKFPRNMSQADLITLLDQEAEAAISQTEQVIRKRIDNLGVVQPKVQRLEGTGRIIVELPGVKDKKRVRELLVMSAKLEFWEANKNNGIYNSFIEANDIIAATQTKKNQPSEETQIEADSVEVSISDSSAATADSTLSKDTTELSILEQLKADGDSEGTDSTAAAAADEQLTDAERKAKFPLTSILYANLTSDNSQFAEGPFIGFARVRDTSQINTYLKLKKVKMLFPKMKFFWEAKAFPLNDGSQAARLISVKVMKRDGTAPLGGEAIDNATSQADAMGRSEVSMTMNADGATGWKNMTAEAAKNNPGYIAIILDGKVYSAPSVREEIAGGRSSISGNFTVQETKDLANVLKSGKLDARANIIEEAIVGPSLGQKSVNNGLMSFLIALAVILIYMIFYYAKAGLAADVALIANIFFVVGVLASIGATLTLPGIAGIVLTIGMSVDANVLIYERIREEIAQGKGQNLAIVDGYNNAYSSIIDANITTFLTGVILWVFGSGPIQGFATTLMIGIGTSLFSAIFITRLIFEYMLDKKGEISFSTSITEGAFKNVNFTFVTKRKIFYAISSLVVIGGIASLATRGFDLGVDFTGGRTYLVEFEQDVDNAEIKKNLGAEFGTKPEVKTFGSNQQVKITTKYLIDEEGDGVEDKVESALKTGLDKYSKDYTIQSSQKVGPTIADDLFMSAMWSVLFSLLVIFLYIVLRFRKASYGFGALVAMAHDVLIVLSIFSIFYGVLPFSLEIDQAFIAALLTVVGYSINDTVVVFDRIREHIGLYKRKPLGELVNGALNSTLSRTFNTSLSTFFVLLMIFVFGGEVIRGFVFALMVGVVVGTYSSLCVAAPIVVDFTKEEENKK